MELEEKLLYATSRSEIIMDVRERRGKISIELRRSGYSRFTRGEIVNTKDGLKRIAEINGGINYIMEDGSYYDYDKVEEWHPSRDELNTLYEQLSKKHLSSQLEFRDHDIELKTGDLVIAWNNNQFTSAIIGVLNGWSLIKKGFKIGENHIHFDQVVKFETIEQYKNIIDRKS